MTHTLFCGSYIFLRQQKKTLDTNSHFLLHLKTHETRNIKPSAEKRMNTAYTILILCVIIAQLLLLALVLDVREDVEKMKHGEGPRS